MSDSMNLSRNQNTPSRIKRRIAVLRRELAYRERINRLLEEEQRLMKALTRPVTGDPV